MDCFIPFAGAWGRWKKAKAEIDKRTRLEVCIKSVERQEEIYTQFVQDISKKLETTQRTLKQKLASTPDRTSIRNELKLLLKAKMRSENEKTRYCTILEKLSDTKANAETMLRNVMLMESLRETGDVMNGVNVNVEDMDKTMADIEEFQQKVNDIDGVVESLAKSLETSTPSDDTNQQLEDELEALVKGMDQLPVSPKISPVPPIDKNGGGGTGVVEKKAKTNSPPHQLAMKNE